MNTHELFLHVYNGISNLIQFDPVWSNKIGHFHHAVDGDTAPKIKTGKIGKAITPGGRKIILIGTRLDNVILFERFSKGENNDVQVIYLNCSQNFQLGQWALPGAVSYDDLKNLIDLKGGLHIGQVIEDIYMAMNVKKG